MANLQKKAVFCMKMKKINILNTNVVNYLQILNQILNSGNAKSNKV